MLNEDRIKSVKKKALRERGKKWIKENQEKKKKERGKMKGNDFCFLVGGWKSLPRETSVEPLGHVPILQPSSHPCLHPPSLSPSHPPLSLLDLQRQRPQRWPCILHFCVCDVLSTTPKAHESACAFTSWSPLNSLVPPRPRFPTSGKTKQARWTYM